VPRSTRSWLLTVAERRIVDDSRRRARLLPAELATFQPDTDAEPPLASALGLLSPDDRRALFLRVVEERTHADLAAAMGCSEGAARMRVSRALRRLRRGLETDV
jgi:RNA polymerase sigma-70 factor (ECF subfamily)